MESFFAPILTALAIIFTYTQLTYTLISTTVNKQLAKVACEKDGSEFLTWCSGTSYACMKKYSDAGSPCNKSAGTCQGFCVKTTNAQGVCSAYPQPKHLYDQFLSHELEIALNTENNSPTINIPQPCPIK